jgi:hypothetical protein
MGSALRAPVTGRGRQEYGPMRPRSTAKTQVATLQRGVSASPVTEIVTPPPLATVRRTFCTPSTPLPFPSPQGDAGPSAAADLEKITI